MNWKRVSTTVVLRYREENGCPSFEVLRWELKIHDQAPVAVCVIIPIGLCRTHSLLPRPTILGLKLLAMLPAVKPIFLVTSVRIRRSWQAPWQRPRDCPSALGRRRQKATRSNTDSSEPTFLG